MTCQKEILTNKQVYVPSDFREVLEPTSKAHRFINFHFNYHKSITAD